MPFAITGLSPPIVYSKTGRSSARVDRLVRPSAVLFISTCIGATEPTDDFIVLIFGDEQPLFDTVVTQFCRCRRRCPILTAGRNHRAGLFVPFPRRLARRSVR